MSVWVTTATDIYGIITITIITIYRRADEDPITDYYPSIQQIADRDDFEDIQQRTERKQESRKIIYYSTQESPDRTHARRRFKINVQKPSSTSTIQHPGPCHGRQSTLPFMRMPYMFKRCIEDLLTKIWQHKPASPALDKR